MIAVVPQEMSGIRRGTFMHEFEVLLGASDKGSRVRLRSQGSTYMEASCPAQFSNDKCAKLSPRYPAFTLQAKSPPSQSFEKYRLLSSEFGEQL